MSPETWESFFLGELGAAAALGGLLFVSLSINIERIIKSGGLPERGLEALIILMGILIVASLMLMPHQSLAVQGWEILGAGLAVWAIGTKLCLIGIKISVPEFRREVRQNLITFQIASLPYFVSGILLLAGYEAGFYWLGATMLLGIAKAVLEAWVLLVEINR
jgi:hypothetical protein